MQTPTSQQVAQIRPLQRQDLPLAISLWESTEGLGTIDPLPKLESYLDRNAGISAGAFVADNGDTGDTGSRSETGKTSERLVAAVLCGHDGRRGYLYHLAVAPDYRKQQLATRLVEHCLKSLATAGIHRCSAFLYKENDVALKFWLRSAWLERTDLHVVCQDIASQDADHVT